MTNPGVPANLVGNFPGSLVGAYPITILQYRNFDQMPEIGLAPECRLGTRLVFQLARLILEEALVLRRCLEAAA